MNTPTKILFAMLAGLAAILLIMGCLVGQAKADECQTEADITKSVTNAVPSVSVVSIGEKSVAPFIAAFNAEPPVSTAHADRILIFQLDSYPNLSVAFFEHGCATGHGTITKSMLGKFMGMPS